MVDFQNLFLINMGLSLRFGAPHTMKHNGIKYNYLYYYQCNKLDGRDFSLQLQSFYTRSQMYNNICTISSRN